MLKALDFKQANGAAVGIQYSRLKAIEFGLIISFR